ncbi:MAG: acylphosphatase [Waddliaceae bacterium]|nr:acylphosphatase [Waddliaceae bacterium]
MGQYVEAHAFVYGHVQGVFFRDMTKRYAEEIGVVGNVRNCSDGSVEIFVQGSRDDVERLFEMLDAGVGRVDSMSIEYREIQERYTSFSIE